MLIAWSGEQWPRQRGDLPCRVSLCPASLLDYTTSMAQKCVWRLSCLAWKLKVMLAQVNNSYKYVFVCVLHHSGTSLLAHNISHLENRTGFSNTPPFVSDEGQNLQDVYPF